MFEIFAALVQQELSRELSRTPLKRRIKIGTWFFENSEKQIVTRVTDREFDTIGEKSRTVQTRNLGLFDDFSFTNKITRPINLLRV